MGIWCDKFGRKISDVPKEKHWVILVQDQYSSPGYDAGDPPDRHDMLDYRIFYTEEAWLKEIEKLQTADRRESFMPIVVYPATIETVITVKVT